VTGTQTDHIRYGAGAFFGNGDSMNTHMRVSGDKARGEDRAVIAMIGKLARTVDLNTELTVRVGSKRVHRMLTRKLEKLEDRGFVDVPEGEAMQSSLAAMRRRGSALWLRLINGPGSDIPHREAQRLASRGCQEATVDKDELKLEPRFARTGVRLEVGSQNLFYKLIHSRKKGAPRRQTTMQVDIVRWGVHEVTGELPSEETAHS
jgi:hypothetical protein